MEGASGPTLLWRGLTRRCPRCGQGRLFRRWLTMSPRCPRCGLDFERGDGFWLGSMAVNLGVTEVLFGALLVTVAALTWPEVPWTALTIAAGVTNAVLPVLLFPFAKTTFLAIDLLMHRMDRLDRSSSERT